jgi:hypothetical protein
MRKFARVCTATNKGMNRGFCVFDGVAYFIEEKHLIEFLRKRVDGIDELSDEDMLEYCFENEDYYYTEWSVEDSDELYDENGNQIV